MSSGEKLFVVVLLLLLIEFSAILVNGVLGDNKINQLRDSDEPLSRGQLFYSEPFANEYQRDSQQQQQSPQHHHNQQTHRLSSGDLEGDIYNHEGHDLHEHDHQTGHHQLDELEYNGISRGEDDRSAGQEQSVSNLPFSETPLSGNNVTNHETTNGSPATDQLNENNLSDKTFLTRRLVERTCQLDRGSQRSEQLNDTYLTYCSRYKLENLLSNEILMFIMHHDSRDCEKLLNEFIQLDETINQFDSLFIKLLSRYNCHNGYSVKWNCHDCKKAYKDWLCSNHLPFYMNGERIKPCVSFCERVEQRCPYLHPITREQYGGQPVFICRDPNIPFVPAITPDIPYSEPGRCYDLCHLTENLTELVIDSLSKYDYDKCPDRSSIAGEVRNEQNYMLGSQNGTKLEPTMDSGDYPDSHPDENTIVIANRTNSGGQTKVLMGHTERKTVHVHNKKLEELREVLANYKNQAKTHRYHADHSSVDHSKNVNEIHSS